VAIVLSNMRSGMSRKLEEKGLTGFQIRVLLNTMKIPKGRTVTYKQLASMSGRPKAYRAVGTALKKNPFAPRIPCHRVVRSDGTPGNYSARGGTRRKVKMLKSEGAI
jgi:methylated-DNA-[protein]-cysteine S-methyltransferase